MMSSVMLGVTPSGGAWPLAQKKVFGLVSAADAGAAVMATSVAASAAAARSLRRMPPAGHEIGPMSYLQAGSGPSRNGRADIYPWTAACKRLRAASAPVGQERLAHVLRPERPHPLHARPDEEGD